MRGQKIEDFVGHSSSLPLVERKEKIIRRERNAVRDGVFENRNLPLGRDYSAISAPLALIPPPVNGLNRDAEPCGYDFMTTALGDDVLRYLFHVPHYVQT